jgi:isoleucyl-tRNA synthetase
LLKSSRLFLPFVDNLSNWYIRRSRKRFQKAGDIEDKKNAYQTLYAVLVTLSKLLAPFTPFIAEEIYQNLTGQEVDNSVHLTDFPKADENLINIDINQKMAVTRQVIEMGLSQRSQLGNQYKTRQPLASLKYGKP